MSVIVSLLVAAIALVAEEALDGIPTHKEELPPSPISVASQSIRNQVGSTNQGNTSLELWELDMSNIIEVAVCAVMDQIDDIRSLVDNDDTSTKRSSTLTIHSKLPMQILVPRLDGEGVLKFSQRQRPQSVANPRKSFQRDATVIRRLDFRCIASRDRRYLSKL